MITVGVIVHQVTLQGFSLRRFLLPSSQCTPGRCRGEAFEEWRVWIVVEGEVDDHWIATLDTLLNSVDLLFASRPPKWLPD